MILTGAEWSIGGMILTGGVWSIGGMILRGGNRSTGRNTCHSATFSIRDVTRTDVGTNPGLRDEEPATDRLSHSMTLRDITPF
jgi:hypothetical protein